MGRAAPWGPALPRAESIRASSSQALRRDSRPRRRVWDTFWLLVPFTGPQAVSAPARRFDYGLKISPRFRMVPLSIV
eukprot:7451675-Pyramimonas_sp.AAC.1